MHLMAPYYLGPIPWLPLHRRQAEPRHQEPSGAHANVPEASAAQTAPWQQSVLTGSQGSPAAVQRSPAGGLMVALHALSPGAPVQRPLQQSAPAAQRAPRGAHRS